MVPKILIADANRDMRELLALHLRNAGYRIEVAEDGVVAGYCVLRERPDLILCETELPRLDGFELVRALRQDRVLHDIPVVFLTAALTDAQSRAKALALSLVSFLPKPIRADALLSFVAGRVPGGLIPIA